MLLLPLQDQDIGPWNSRNLSLIYILRTLWVPGDPHYMVLDCNDQVRAFHLLVPLQYFLKLSHHCHFLWLNTAFILKRLLGRREVIVVVAQGGGVVMSFVIATCPFKLLLRCIASVH